MLSFLKHLIRSLNRHLNSIWHYLFEFLHWSIYILYLGFSVGHYYIIMIMLYVLTCSFPFEGISQKSGINSSLFLYLPAVTWISLKYFLGSSRKQWRADIAYFKVISVAPQKWNLQELFCIQKKKRVWQSNNILIQSSYLALVLPS